MWNSDPVDSFMRNLLRGDSSAAAGNHHYQAADSMINMFGTTAGGSQPSPLSTSRALSGGGGYGRQAQYQQPQQTHQQQQQYHHHQQQQHSHHNHHQQQQHATQRPASPDPDYFVKKLLNDDGMYRTARDVVNATMTNPAASRASGDEDISVKRGSQAPNPLPAAKPKAKRTYKKKSLPKSKSAAKTSGVTAAAAAAPAAIAPAAASTNAAVNSPESNKKDESSSKNGEGEGDKDGKMPPISDHFLELVKFQMDIWGKNQPQLFQSICTLINTTFPFMAPLRFKTIHYVIGQVREKNPWLSQSLVLYYFPPSPAAAPDNDNNNLVEGSYPGDEEKTQTADPPKDGTGGTNQQPQKRKRGRPRKDAGDTNKDGSKTPPASKAKSSMKADTPKTRAQAGADGTPANRTPNKLILQERATDKLKSGEIIPDGWLKRTFQRTSGNSAGTCDTYWISPVTQRKLRSLNEVSRFLLYLKESPTNDEKYAWKKLRESSRLKKNVTAGGEGKQPTKKSAKGAASSGGGIAAAAAAAAAVVAAAYGGAGIPKQNDGVNSPGEMII